MLQGANGKLEVGAIGRGRKLTCRQAVAIKTASGTMAAIAKSFGVSTMVVFNIKNGISYRDCFK